MGFVWFIYFGPSFEYSSCWCYCWLHHIFDDKFLLFMIILNFFTTYDIFKYLTKKYNKQIPLKNIYYIIVSNKKNVYHIYISALNISSYSQDTNLFKQKNLLTISWMENFYNKLERKQDFTKNIV